jgi:indolepyruvate ferredoxin oxidoreductase beta subunit
MKDILNFLLAGVGGQGTILASDVLVNVGLAAGLSAKQAEVHGMSQRGGDVTSHVRWGKVVYAPMAGAGEVDVLLAFEKVEALRNLRACRPGALVLVNDEAIAPVTVTSGDQRYPSDEQVRTAVARLTGRGVFLDGAGIAAAFGNPRAANIVMLGALAGLLEREALVPSLTAQMWLAVIADRVPAKYLELNRQAFQAGRHAVLMTV